MIDNNKEIKRLQMPSYQTGVNILSSHKEQIYSKNISIIANWLNYFSKKMEILYFHDIRKK